MKVNFVDIKELSHKKPESGQAVPDAFSPQSAATPENEYLTEYAIKEMFDLHMEASRTLWDRKMFDDELKREGSGFIACFSGEYKRKDFGIPGMSGTLSGQEKFNAADISSDIKLNLQSGIIGFFIFYNVMDEMHVLDITVARDMQSKGFGSLILDYVIKKYSALNIKYFFLEVRESNSAAIKLYKKFGFKVFLLRKGYYEDNGEDALCMVKEL